MNALFGAIDSSKDGKLDQQEAEAFKPSELPLRADMLSAIRGGYGRSETSEANLADLLSSALDKAA